MNKAKAQLVHFRHRAIIRTGLNLGRRSNEEIVNIIKRNDGSVINLKSQSLRVRIKEIKYRGEWLVVVYDKNTKRIVTILPKQHRYYKMLPIGADLNRLNKAKD